MLYCACSVSLCCLEVLVHTDPDLIPDNLVWSWVDLPSEPEVFDGGWRITDPGLTRSFGKRWIDGRGSVAMRVPSVIVPHTDVDFNVLLNPTHDTWTNLHWQRGGKFAFDPRLFSEQPFL